MKDSLQSAMSLYTSGNRAEAEQAYRRILSNDLKNIQALHILGIITGEAERYDEAVQFLEQAIKIKQTDPLLFFTLGITLQKWGKPDEALLKYKKATALNADYFDAHIAIADILKNQNKFDEAELKYKRVVALKPGHVNAHHALGQVLHEQGKLAEAAQAYQKTIALKPDHPDAHFNLANIYRDQEKLDEATAHYANAISLKPDNAQAYVSLGLILQKRERPYDAALLYEHALTLCPDATPLLAEYLRINYHLCAWDKIGELETRLLEKVRQNRPGIFPFIVLEMPSTAEEQFEYTKSYAQNLEQPQQALFTYAPRKPDQKIKIGYLSSDYWNHATAHLMAELFERHDRSRFHITAYSHGQNDKSAVRARLEKAFDSFVELGHLTDQQAAQKIYDDKTDILIDLKGGFTPKARIGIAAYRPAPVQVNYVGYPGTMGASFIDYIIADRFIIPEEYEKFYSEKVVCLPNSYQPNDTHREIAATTPTRTACGLPEQGFVFCCFNANYKIRSQMFDIWMRVMQQVPGSVLWLLEDHAPVKENLCREAQQRGIDPARIIFAPRIPLPGHLARQKLADLFIDTLPVNAHTTTSDALWTGLPVLTCVGNTFAGRVAGSLLKAAHLPELITYSLEEYEALALRLAQNPADLATIRQKLERTRLQVPLFDIENYVKHIEKAYQAMWQIWQNGGSPKGFTVA